MTKEQREELDMVKLSKSYRSVKDVLENSDIDKSKLEDFYLYIEGLRYDRNLCNTIKGEKDYEIRKLQKELINAKEDNDCLKKFGMTTEYLHLKNEYMQYSRYAAELKESNSELREELEDCKNKIEKWKAMFTSVSLANANLINKGYSESEE